jgi:hypothetical protein
MENRARHTCRIFVRRATIFKSLAISESDRLEVRVSRRVSMTAIMRWAERMANVLANVVSYDL